MRYIGVILIVSAVFFSFDLPKIGLRKMDKTLDRMFPEQQVEKKPINLMAAAQKKLTFNLSNNTVYKVLSNNRVISYAYLSKGFGKMNEFDYMVVFNPDLSILKIKVLVYREDQGGEIGSIRWLKQFVGKSDTRKMKFGHDIQNISGATLSARSLTEDVKKVTKRIQELQQKQLL